MSNKLKFILNTSVEYFAVSITGPEKETHTAAIMEFLNNDELTVITAVLNKSGGKISFHHRIPNDEDGLLFYKIPQVSSTKSSEKQQSIGMITLEGGLVKSIYNSISRVFSPRTDTRKNAYSPELSGLLENLHSSLGTTLGVTQSGIISVKDEIKYWKDKLSKKSSSRIDREASQVFLGVLENIDQQMSFIDEHNNANSMEEFLDSSHNSLDELWRLPYQYPQTRMIDLLDVIGNRIFEVSVEHLLAEDIWNLSSHHVNNLMSQCIDNVDSWIQLCDTLTRLFWPNYVQHAWLGEPHVPTRGQLLKERLIEIRNIKNLYKQIATLLDENEVRNMCYSTSPFKNFNIFDTTTLGQSKWNKALQQFEQLLQPIDERIASALRAQLHNYLSNPRQVIFIFSKYETLIQRPVVLELLTIEREQFLQSLQILLQDLRKAMTDTNMEPDAGHLSVICNECRWLKVVEYQIQEIEKVSHLISGREGYDKINKAVQEIKEETESLLKTNFEIWCGQCTTAVKSGELKLRDDLPVVKFEKEGRQLMRVTFNPKLVTFCQDVREFENLGYNVPLELRASATHASKFISYARRLQQVATFHNTIGDRMIPCQRPIMLKNAMELSKLVQSQTVAWNDEESVQQYVDMLQTAVSKLSADNTLLVGYHEQAKRTVVKLMNTDLFTHSQVWKDEMRHLRELVATLERQGFNNLDAFKLHWDHQLYKVLEYQYIIGLVDMNNKLPDIYVDISFRQRQLTYRPSEEDIRDKYFTQLRRFIERPCTFRGLSEKSTDLFKTMVEINRLYFGPLFKRAEELFDRLQEFKKIWMPWVALGCVDVEELCNIHLNSAEDWDRNFKACKNFSQKIAKIQNMEESIDCIVINISPLRADIELISRRYWEALSNSLRTSILTNISMIQEFLQNSLQFLNNVPMDEASITESGMKYEKMMSELTKVSETLALVKSKDTCLAGWCKERVSALTGITLQWEKLQPLIENHAVILQRQVDMIKDQAQAQMQNLQNEADKFLLRWESTIAELEANEDASLQLFKERQEHWRQIANKKTQLLEECAKFNMEFPEQILQPFTDIADKIKLQSAQWQVYDNYLTELDAILSEEWAIYRRRPYILIEFVNKWGSSVNSSVDLASKRIRHNVERLENVMPVLQQLQADGLNERHWARIFMLLEKPETKSPHSIYVRDILEDCGTLQQVASEISNIVKQASSEQIVRQTLTELDQWSVTAALKLLSHKDSAGNSISLIKNYQEILNKIGDNQSLLQSAKNSIAFEVFSDQAELWENRLNTLDTLLTSLSQSQRRWVYLEPVFGAGTLENEKALFKRIDKDFRYIMREIELDPKVISLIKINNITTISNSMEAQLTRCQGNLMSFIMEKRNLFPRFYFLGDDDLLEILGQASKDAGVMQRHIKKLFPGIHSLQIEQDGHNVSSITSVYSSEGDQLKLKRPVEMSGPIEVWLNNLVSSIQNTLKDEIIECYNSTADTSYNESILESYPIQVLSTSRAIHFTKQAEKCITSMSVRKLHQTLNAEITQYATLKNHTSSALLQLKLRSLLLDLVHYVTVVEELLQHNVMHLNDWHWLCQLRFYSAGADGRTVCIRMVYAEFEYSYEYLGNPNKLVNTSLTHKCYLILTQAMQMGLGGNPFGPAGTGKTECVKALGGMLGRLVLVFNCDENVDNESMSLILTGLARCGAWGCFDEFNRLQEATLSAISMLIQPIQSALKDKVDTVEVVGKQIKLNHHCGIFVTLNPAGIEYGGRQKLPGNIQALFRPIVMQQPEPREIARVMLFVEGFQQAVVIAERMVELFDLCAKMLSAQRHYDWGLRELKSILVACGRDRVNVPLDNGRDIDDSKHIISTAAAADIPANTTHTEMSIVVQCLRTSTMSKLESHDVARFDMLLRNVFPEIELISRDKSALQQALADAFKPLGLIINDMQIEKALQLHEQLTKRMGVVVVGPPGCGKSTIIALLRQALTTSVASTSSAVTVQQIRVHTISPKSMSRVQLLGRLDPDTRQWMDGVLTSIAATVNSEPPHIHSWIVCDGSIDPEWIEALNSVLDDNKLLTLPSGWRIQFGNNVNFIFETDDVRHASPATISRIGVISVSYADYPEKEIMNLMLSKEELGDLWQNYIEENFRPILDWLQKNQLMPSARSFNMLRALLLHLHGVQGRDEFCIAICNAIFGFLPAEKHNEVANMIFDKANIFISNPNRAELAHFNAVRSAVELYESDTNITTSSDIHLIQTAAVKSYLNILNTFLQQQQANMPFLIVGPSGSAKTLLIQQAVQEHSGYELVVINCSTQLTPQYILHCLKQNCLTVSGLRGREYKPKQVRIVLFLKNLDLCHVDAWGASEVVEFLQQLVQRSGFYTADTLEWINVRGLQVCASTSPKVLNAATLQISPRYLALNQLLRVSYPTDMDMLIIMQSRLEPMLTGGYFTCEPSTTNIQYVVEGLLELFQKLQTTFSQSTPQGYAHYQFSPKLLIQVFENLKYYHGNSFNDALHCELISAFKDRLVSDEDANKFDTILKQTLRKVCGREKIYFVPKSTKHNAELQTMQHDEWLEELQKQIAICNAESFIIDEPITRELLEYTAKVSRTLARDGTHLIVLGQAGGRQLDAIYAAATMQQTKIHITQGGPQYGLMDFYNDLKLTMQTAALENQSICLLIDHCWFSFVPDIMKPVEAILEGSDILDLFGDDLESIASSLKHVAISEGYQDSMGSFFMKRARQNLHLIILLDSTNSKINEYFNKYSALYRNMEFLFIRTASKESYANMPKKFIEMLSETASGKGKVPVSSYFSEALDSLILTQPPIRFYQLIRSYYYIYCECSQDIENRLQKLQLGVDKLAAAYAVVDTLKSNAEKQEVALAEKRQLANEALEMISVTMRNANEQKTNMLELKKQTQVSSEKLKERQKEIQQELSEVEPILAEASAAVGQIKSEALSEIRSLRAPPEAIRDILEGVLRLMGIRDTSWNSMKTFLAKRGVKEDIRSLDPARINPENCDAVEKLLAAKADSFEIKNAKRASAAAAPLAAWVRASVRYSKVIQSIKPLEREQNELQQNLEVAENEMQSLVIGLDDVDNRVKQLSAKLNSYTQEAAVLELKLEEARGTLNAAEVLVEKLSSEYHTWSKQCDEYKLSHKTLDTKSLLIALTLNYFAHMALEHRRAAMTKLTTDLQLDSFDVRKNLLTDQEQIIWESMGLARDAQIIENAALLRQMLQLPLESYPIPLVLDPTGTALTWLEEYLHSKSISFEITTQNNERLTYSLELAVRFGKILIVQDCQDVRPPLMQLIAARFHVNFNKVQLEVGNKMVDLHKEFRLVLFSKTNRICIEPQSAAYLAYLPFTVTAVGLTDQLMSKAIVLKNPELEQKRIHLLKNESVLLKQRLELEDKLLEELSTAQGDILKNEKLLQTLNEVKESSSFIDKSLKESALIKETLLGEHTQLRELCSMAAQFYIGLIVSYELSVLVFIEIFLNSLQSSEIGPTSNQNESNIYEKLVRSTFQYLARSIPRSSHLTLQLFVCKCGYPECIKDTEWELFITNFMSGADASAASRRTINLPDCIGKEMGLKIQMLFSQCPILEEQMQLQKDYAWRNFIENQTQELPGEISSSFHRLLIIQILRPDLVIKQLRATVSEILGIAAESIIQPTVEQLVEESSCDKPILIITQTENDPAAEVRSIAAKKIGIERYNELSIGRGIERRALEAIRAASETGKWICIKNVHLVPSWLTELERELSTMKKTNEFRLWLICESTRDFSEAVMYKFVKVLYEYPSGLKNKIHRMTQNFAIASHRSAILKEAKLVKMRIVLFIGTAILQERRKFIPQGWSKYYEFGESDLKAALQVLSWLDAMISSGRCDWNIMQRLCENVAFGGRISNMRDLQVLRRYLEEFCNAEVLSNRWRPLNMTTAIYVPTTTQIQEYFNVVAKFPDIDEPEIFQLSKHSNISREIEYSKEIIKELRTIYYRSDDSNSSDNLALNEFRHKLERQIKPILTLWRKLAINCTVVHTASEMHGSKQLTTPWALFVSSELKLALKCFQEVHTSLSQVHNTLKESQFDGKVTTNSNLLQALTENQVPINWRKLWNGPQTAIDYLKGLMVRSQAAEQRYRADYHIEFIEQIDLVHVFNCETLLSCLKLINSCKMQISCKDLMLHSWVSGERNASGVVVKLTPVKVDGAVFSYGKLLISTTSESRSFDERSPEIQITYCEENFKSAKSDNITVPLYANASRDKMLCQLNVPTSEKPDSVLLSGAALIVADY